MSTLPKIVMLNAHELEPECTHWKGIRMGMKYHGVDYVEIDIRNTGEEEIERRVYEEKPDVLLYGLSDVINSNLFHTYKGTTALWWAEYRDENTGGYLEGNFKDKLDYFFVSNDSQADFWEEKIGVRSQYLGQAGFKGEITKNYDYDVVFIGGKISEGPLGRRYRLFKQLKTPYTHINKKKLEDRMEIYRQMPSVYGTSKICLDSSHSWEGKYYASGRYYHIACNGGFSVSKRFNGCEELFPEGVGKVYFDTAEEADELLQYYLKHPSQRAEIALRGQEHALRYHTYINRIKDLLWMLKK